MSMIEELLRDNIIYVWFGLWLVLMAYLGYTLLKGRGKILVRVKTPLKENHEWRKANADGKTITMQKASKKKAGWSFEFSNKSLVPVKRFFGLVQAYAIDIFFEATKAIEYNYDVKEADQPHWDKTQSKKFIDAKILETAGKEPKEKTSSTLIIIIGFMVAILLVIQILQLVGVRIGGRL